MPLVSHYAIGLEQRRDAARHGLDDRRPTLLHSRKIERDAAQLDAVNRKLVLGSLVQLRGLEECLRRNAARVQAGAPEGIAAVQVLPFIHTGHFELVLGRANRRRVTCGSGADNHHIEALAHMLNTMRAGSSRHCLTVTRNSTASRPSINRWS